MGRRALLAGAGLTLLGGVAAACSGDDPAPEGSPDAGSSGGGDDGEPGGATDDEWVLVQRFSPTVLVPGVVRLPFSLARNADFVDDGPTELAAQILDQDSRVVVERTTAPRWSTPTAAYYAWQPTIDEPGLYTLALDGSTATANFQVFPRDEVRIPLVGDPLPGFDTPTPGAPGGVDPICTRDPECGFHSITLTEALNTGLVVAYIVGTPSHCATGTCAPALESLVTAAPDYAGKAVFVHAEIYTDNSLNQIAPAVDALGLSFEPALFVTRPDGTIATRLDAIWGDDELRQALDAAIA